MRKKTIVFHSGKLASNLNEEQKIAVINIMESKNRPLPYLVFGPAGQFHTKNTFEIQPNNFEIFF